jgi:phage-related protein
MTTRTKKLPAVFYRTATGHEPVREWLKKELTREDRKILGKDIQKVEFGWPMGLPTCRPLAKAKGLWEVRSDISEGRTARVFFCVTGGRMILLHGFVKKTQKTPAPDIKLALSRKRKVER